MIFKKFTERVRVQTKTKEIIMVRTDYYILGILIASSFTQI